MKTIQLKCTHCGKDIIRLLKEYKRNKDKQQKIFCSRSCVCSYKNLHTPKEWYVKHCSQIREYSGNRLDKFSPFKPYLNKGRASNKRHQMSLSAEYLKSLWEKQNGICPYTNLKMVLPKNTLDNTKIKSLKKASLDRIDSSKGYIEGNVEFICQGINLAKKDYTKEETVSFIKEIKTPVG